MTHTPKHVPASGTGYQVCECGATRRVDNGVPEKYWHECNRCVIAGWHNEQTIYTNKEGA